MKHIRNRKGFTLIEVLIVVVIIGILASLILPRMLAQPERAVTAEALNYLGVIRRAQDAASQPTGTYLAANSGPQGGAPSADQAGANWTALGFQPLPASSRFTYTCAAGTPGDLAADPPIPPTNASCTATRNTVGGTARNGGTIRMDLTTGFVAACGGAAPNAYTLAGTANTQTAVCV